MGRSVLKFNEKDLSLKGAHQARLAKSLGWVTAILGAVGLVATITLFAIGVALLF